MPQFTVVIPTYNRAKLIERAIQSVFNQTSKDWKLLIMDDASTDHTEQVAARYLDHPNVEYHRLEHNVGISRVMNEALERVDTPFLVQLDSDDWLQRKALEVLAEEIERDQEQAALYYGNMRVWRLSGGRYRLVRYVRQSQIKDKYDFLLHSGWMVTPRCYRVSALKEVGGWDVSDPYEGRLMEDRRMVLRLLERYPVRWIDRRLYNRTKHSKQLTHESSIKKRNHLRRLTYESCLERWGGEYRAVYGYKRSGYLYIKKLKRVKRR